MIFPAFIRESPRLAVFALLATASSGFGQTFFFSVFGSGIRETFALQNSTYGLAPIFCSMLVLVLTDFTWTPNLYLALCGISLGFIGAAGGAIWPERYGVRHIGAIRSVAQASMVFSTALSPILVGVLLDASMATTGIGVLFAVLILVSVVLAQTAVAPKQGA